MPTLDRRITLTYRQPDTRSPQGDSIPGDIIWTRTLWARHEREVVLESRILQEGVRIVGERQYRIRYIPELLTTSLTRFSGEDEYGNPFTLAEVGEPQDSGRRRWLVITL